MREAVETSFTASVSGYSSTGMKIRSAMPAFWSSAGQAAGPRRASTYFFSSAKMIPCMRPPGSVSAF